MTKALTKAIIKRSQLQNEYFSERTVVNQLIYELQRNICSRLYKKEKRKYHNNLDLSRITDNKKFWKRVKPLLSKKEKNSGKIFLTDKNDNQIHGNTQSLFRNISQLT